MKRNRYQVRIRARLLHYSIHILSHLRLLVRWFLLSLVTGGIVGGVGAAFAWGMTWATWLRTQYPFLLLFLPISGLAIIGIYRTFHFEKDSGTDTVLSTLHAKTEIPARMAPLIFVSTILTHLCGGSSGREGAALQIGGSLGNLLGRWFHLQPADKRVLVMCGMSAAFSAVFGTPLAAVFFAMEVGSVGIMYYAALVPCVTASFYASFIAKICRVEQEEYLVVSMPDWSLGTLAATVILGLCCAGLSVLFCILLHETGCFLRKKIPNSYIRIVSVAIILVILGLFPNNTDYLGAGMPVLLRALSGQVVWYAFLMKLLFTVLTMAAGFKGGEIVPSFFIGATFGCLYGSLLHLSPSLFAALGMIAVFCGVTNCPITSLLIAFELFGMGAMPYFLICIAVSYMLSGYYGLYHSQKIVYSKYAPKYINRNTRN
ncbi:MAG: chloride channel protein [Oscillospiraceae bacterium]|nr:chloride channel protein [Oscillospiraceae bacterium]